MGRFLGEGGATGTLVWNPTTKILQWSTTGARDPAVYVNGTLVARSGASGSTNWIYSGERFLFELRDNGIVLASVEVAPDGTVIGQTIYGGEIPTVGPTPGPHPQPRPGTGTFPDAGASWFEGSTNIFGIDIPNLGLIAGGGLLLLVAIKKRKK
jgi:hypothetical protein